MESTLRPKTRLMNPIVAGLSIVALILFAVAAAACAEEDATVRMGTEGAYPPYSFVNDAEKSTDSSVNSATSCAAARNSNAPGSPMNGTPLFRISSTTGTTPSWPA